MNYPNHGRSQTVQFSQARSRNMARECSAKGCHETRDGLDAYCSIHNRTYRSYGHPKGRPIAPQNYRPYLRDIEPLFEVNRQHPGFVAALGYVTDWMRRAVDNEEAYRGAPEVARVARHGVTPLKALAEVCAMYCWIRDNPRLLPNTRAEDFAMSRAFMALAPRPRRVTHEAAKKGTSGYQLRPRFADLDSIGSHLRSVLVYFVSNVAEAVATRDARARETLQQLRAPLLSPTAVYMAEAAKAAGSAGVQQCFPTRDVPAVNTDRAATGLPFFPTRTQPSPVEPVETSMALPFPTTTNQPT